MKHLITFFQPYTGTRYALITLWAVGCLLFTLSAEANGGKPKGPLKATTTLATDTDGDGVDDAADLDDDNDGILDTVEDAVCQPVNYNTNLTEKAKIQVSTTAAITGNINVLLDGNVNNSTFYYNNTAQAVAGKVYVQMVFPKPTLLKGFELTVGGGYLFANGTVMKVQGSNDGTTWTDLLTSTRNQTTPACSYGTCTAAEGFAFSSNTIAYTSYRLLGVSGTSRNTPWVNELFFSVAPAANCDFDGDGVPNRLDLDSDNDGIPDNVEVQPTLTYAAPNADGSGLYATNQGVNSAYPGGLTPVNTDGDSSPDFIDTDSDDDKLLDKTESGLTFNGVPGLNGLDSGSETSDDYADVNGVVNVPKSNLASASPGVSEVYYRQRPPAIPIKVCYNKGSYNLGGSEFSNAPGKLTNAVNFGATGISNYQFTLYEYNTSTTPITAANLVANGCQIFQTDPYTTALTAAEVAALKAWAVSMNHVLITTETEVSSFGGSAYVHSYGNTNPNKLTTLGEKIINGPFGTVPPFNQAGSYRGAFTAFPSTACIIIQDGAATPKATGLLNNQTGDFYLGDVDIISELGGLTTTNNITSSTDILFANLYHSAAKLATEGPTNPCTFFDCASAGANAPTLSSNTITGTGSVNLTTITATNRPPGTMLTWHTGTPATTANKIPNPTAYATAGTVYGVFYSTADDCYTGSGSLTSSVVVTIGLAVPQADLSVAVSPATQTGNVGEFLTYTVTLTNAGPATATNVVVDVPMPEPTATLLSATAASGSYNSVSKEWTVPSLPAGSTTLTFTLKVN